MPEDQFNYLIGQIRQLQELVDLQGEEIRTLKSKKRSGMIKPSQREIRDYMLKKGLDFNTSETQSQSFIDHYDSNGWKVGKNAMKSWEAAVRNWLKRVNQYAQPQQQSNVLNNTDWITDNSPVHQQDIYGPGGSQASLQAISPPPAGTGSLF